jgi:hypothetical protein
MRILSALLLTAPFAAAGQVWVVAPLPGPGVDFTSISVAVDAASDGDVVLVKPGTYGEHVAVHGKSIAIASDFGGPVILVGRVKVGSLPAAGSFSLQGFEVIPSPSGAPIDVADCAGSVLFEGCKARGTGSSQSSWSAAGPGCRVIDSAAVVFSACQLAGGLGGSYGGEAFWYPIGGNGTSALSVTNSSVTLHGCVLVGGDGGECDYDPACEGGFGGSGCDAFHGVIHASACRFLGGKGGFGYPYSGYPGSSLDVASSSAVELVACLLSGPAWSVPGSSVTKYAIPPVELEVNAASQIGVKPLREGEVGTLEISGASGAFALLLVAPKLAYTSSPNWLGTALVGAPLSVLPLGVLGASATLAVPFVVPEQGAGIESTFVHLQAATIDAQGALQLGGHRLAVLLDGSF